MSVTRSLFNSEWIDKTLNPDFSSWIQAVPNNRFLARCRVCMKNFTLSNMGRAAVSSHMKSSLHVRKMEASKTCHTITSLVSVKSQPQEQQSINDPSTSCITASVHSDVPREVKEINVNSTDKPTDKLDSFLVKTTVTNSEIIWALKVVMNHLSFRSCKDLGETFRTMFPDSAIAKQFTLSAFSPRRMHPRKTTRNANPERERLTLSRLWNERKLHLKLTLNSSPKAWIWR
jgi:hypothetical protein